MASILAASKPSLVANKASQAFRGARNAVVLGSWSETATSQPQQSQQARCISIFPRGKKSACATAMSKNGWKVALRQPFSSNKKDFYDVLNISKGSDKGAIKKAYFKLAKQYHPDQNPDDDASADKFKEASEAYEVLSDEKQRELYDKYGHAGVDPNSGFGAGGSGGNPFGGPFGDGSFHFSGSPGDEMDAEDLFDTLFGGGRQRRNRGPRKGSDIQMSLSVSFKEAVFGASKDMKYRYQHKERISGKIEIKENNVTVDIPAGISDGMNVRLSGQGPEGDPGAPRGNLILQVIVDDDPDDYFHRNDYDVHTEAPISLTQAVLGGMIDIRTLTGVVEMKIPKGCQVDTKLMMRGKGIQRVQGNSKGNQIVHLKIEVPKNITDRQEELLREFDDESRLHGKGISGRLAKAAGSAFETLFGKKCEKTEEKVNEDAENTDNETTDKKSAAQ